MASGSYPSTPSNVSWLRYTLALLVALLVAGYVFGILGGWITQERRLDTNSIALIVLALVFAALIVNGIEGLTSIAFGSFKAEFAQIRGAQEDQQRQVNSISAVLALLLTDEEQKQLLELGRGETQCLGGHDLRARLRKLRGMRLLQMNKDEAGKAMEIARMTDNTPIDLSEFLTLTELGTRIVEELKRIETEKKNVK